jgi:hypothetical protein
MITQIKKKKKTFNLFPFTKHHCPFFIYFLFLVIDSGGLLVVEKLKKRIMSVEIGKMSNQNTDTQTQTHSHGKRIVVYMEKKVLFNCFCIHIFQSESQSSQISHSHKSTKTTQRSPIQTLSP